MKTAQRLKSEQHNIFTEEINKIVLSSNDDKTVPWIYWTETYAYGRSKYLVSEKEVIKCKNKIKRYKND